jgi:hypothetical protein
MKMCFSPKKFLLSCLSKVADLQSPKGGSVKRTTILVAALALLALAAATAQAETYVEGYIGNNFTVTGPNPVDLSVNPAFRGPTKATLEYPRNMSSAVIGGGKLGTWFSKEGFPHFDYPNWMKYLGVYLDFSYHTMNYQPSIGSRRMDIETAGFPPFFQHYKLLGTANITTIAFMFAFRYGFFPVEKVPFGKLQPYVAVGPGILISGFAPTFMVQPPISYQFFPLPTGNPFFATTSYKSTATLALVTELGVRWMITRPNRPRFFSLDTSVKYRYARPSTTYDINIAGFTHELTYAPQLNLFSIQMGVAYHF